MAYTTLADVKLELKIATLATEADAKLSALIPTAKERIDAFCGRTFEAAADTTRYFGAESVCGDELLVDGDLASVTTLTNGDGAVIPSTEWRPYPRNVSPIAAIKLKSTSQWQFLDADAEISIAGKWAYSVAAPELVERAAIRLVCYWYDLASTGIYGVTVTPETGQIIVPRGMPAEVKDMLTNLKRIST